MEALPLDKSLSPSKQMLKSNPKRMTRNHHHHQQQQHHLDQKKMMMHDDDHHGRSRVHRGNPYTREYSRTSASLPPNYYLHHPLPSPPLFPPPQPPLLPLPSISKPTFLSLPPSRRHHSLSPPSQNDNNIIIKTPFNKVKRPQNPISPKQHTKTGVPPLRSNDAVESSTKTTPLISVEELSVLSTLSPPPSCLPLPKFSVLRQPYNKILSCTVEAATAGEIDDGATDNLRRMLRLR